MRPFWMHQIVEYIIGASFVSTAIASSTPVIPVVIGGIILVNTAVAIGPAGAFRLVHRQVHRVIDVVIMVLIVVASVQPVVEVQNSTRVLMLALALVMAFVWWNSDFAVREERKQRRRSSTAGLSAARSAGQAAAARPDSQELGKAAGRSAAGTYLAAKRLKKAMVDDRRSGAPGSAKPSVSSDDDAGPARPTDPSATP